MSKRIIKLLEGKADFDKKAVRRLAKELDRHPYSQFLHAMYAKALQKTGNKGFEEAVNKAAACAPDQRRFRAFLSDKEKPLLESRAERKVPEKKEAEEIPENPEQAFGPQRKNKVNQQAIIDRFLEAEPRISAPRDDLPAGELAPESIAESDDLISETLAEVLVKQGKNERAIEIFKKLSLKFPEKSSYFAKKIESIK